MQRSLILFSIFLMLFGCVTSNQASQFEVRTSEGAINITFVSNASIDPGTQGNIIAYDQYGSRILEKNFLIEASDMERDFFGKTTTVRKGFVVPLVEPNVSQAIVEIETVNGTLVYTYGAKPEVPGEGISLEVLEHEKTYSVFIDVRGRGGAPVDLEGLYGMVSIKDRDGVLYEKQYTARAQDTTNGRWNILIPKTEVPESFYATGTLNVEVEGEGHPWAAKETVAIPQMTRAERIAQEEKDAYKLSTRLRNKTTYVGFEFTVDRMGPIVRHDETENVEYVIAYVTVKNILDRPQYIAKSDFYYKDSEKNFYPVSFEETGDLPGLMMPDQAVTIPFAIRAFKDTETYRFYYGDKELARAEVDFK